MAIDSQNRIVAGGQGGGDIRIARYTTAGALDTSFDTDGMQSVSINGTDDGEDLVLDNDGRILISGSINGDKDFGIARLKADGSLDTSFATGGADGDGEQTIDFVGGRRPRSARRCWSSRTGRSAWRERADRTSR